MCPVIALSASRHVPAGAVLVGGDNNHPCRGNCKPPAASQSRCRVVLRPTLIIPSRASFSIASSDSCALTNVADRVQAGHFALLDNRKMAEAGPACIAPAPLRAVVAPAGQRMSAQSSTASTDTACRRRHAPTIRARYPPPTGSRDRLPFGRNHDRTDLAACARQWVAGLFPAGCPGAKSSRHHRRISDFRIC